MGFLSFVAGRALGNMAGEDVAELTEEMRDMSNGERAASESARQHVGLTRSMNIKPDSDFENGYDAGYVEGVKRVRRRG